MVGSIGIRGVESSHGETNEVGELPSKIPVSAQSATSHKPIKKRKVPNIFSVPIQQISAYKKIKNCPDGKLR